MPRKICLGLCLLCLPMWAAAASLIAAAASMQTVLPKIVELFQQQGGEPVQISFGASGDLVRQIQLGAPFEMLLAADDVTTQPLHAQRLTQDAGKIYATGKLAVIVAKQSNIALDENLTGLLQALAKTEAKSSKLAIANPEHAPYGQAAKLALQNLGAWQPHQTKLVLAANANQVAQYVATGSALAGLTAWSVAVAPAVSALTRSVAVSERLYTPLLQRMVLMKNASANTQAFYQFMSSRAALELLAQNGLGVAKAQ